MDEARYIDWYEVVQAVANGRSEGQSCPECGDGRLQSSTDGVTVRVRCAACGEGFEGKLAAGRDDGLYAEAAAMQARAERRRGRAIEQVTPRAALIAGGVCAPADDAEVATLTGATGSATPAPTEPAAEAQEPWAWTLPTGSDDVQGLADWMDVVESIHNGRRVGLRCPYCSEPLDQITHQPPFIRVRCAVCGEGFEGRIS